MSRSDAVFALAGGWDTKMRNARGSAQCLRLHVQSQLPSLRRRRELSVSALVQLPAVGSPGHWPSISVMPRGHVPSLRSCPRPLAMQVGHPGEVSTQTIRKQVCKCMFTYRLLRRASIWSAKKASAQDFGQSARIRFRGPRRGISAACSGLFD